MNRWQGKVALVTGASSGIGAAVASKLVENGLQVVALARRVARLETLAAQLNGGKHQGKLHPFKADLTIESDILAAFKYIRDNLETVHVVVNNAGLSKPVDITNGSTEDFKQILDTNLLACVIISREAIKLMRETNVDDGHIFLINSIEGHYVHNLPNLNVYPASKYAVTGLAETLRLELARSKSMIRITSLSPGLVDTEIFEVNGFLENPQVREILAQISSLKSEDIADALLYVLGTPAHVTINELMIRPTGQVF